uniref:ubiquinone biosynthesis accessory factor UbiJ n=1 Tax=Neisseria leonii TaxID=2995413 RepID=UPI003F583170
MKTAMLALTLINHIIRQNPETQAALAGYNGIGVRILAAGFRIHGRFDADGFLQPSDREADTELTFHNGMWQKMLAGQTPGVGDFSIRGDTALGFALLQHMGSLRYHARDDLNRLFGGTAAEHIGQHAGQAAQALKKIGLSLLEQGADFAREPESPVITRAEFDRWAAEVDRLRDDIARLNARLDRLES